MAQEITGPRRKTTVVLLNGMLCNSLLNIFVYTHRLALPSTLARGFSLQWLIVNAKTPKWSKCWEYKWDIYINKPPSPRSKAQQGRGQMNARAGREEKRCECCLLNGTNSYSCTHCSYVICTTSSPLGQTVVQQHHSVDFKNKREGTNPLGVTRGSRRKSWGITEWMGRLYIVKVHCLHTWTCQRKKSSKGPETRFSS